jgi:hypothetical protein
VEILNHEWRFVLAIPTKRISNLAPFDKISKSGDGGHSGDILDTLATYSEV